MAWRQLKGNAAKVAAKEGRKRAKKVALETAEQQLGRPLTDDEREDVKKQVNDALKGKPVYGETED